MATVKREIRVIEEGENAPESPENQDSTAPDADDRASAQSDAAETGFGETGAGEGQFAMPLPSDGMRGIDSQSYLTSSSLGVDLRQARIKRKLDLDKVSEVLRIRREYLQSLEEGDGGKLPGATYAVGFVRTYAGYLGLDPDQAVARYKEEAENLDTRPDLAFPTPAAEARLPGTAILIGSVLVAGVLYGAWYFLSGDDTAETATAETATTETAATAETAKAETETAKPAAPAPAAEAAPAFETAPAASAAEDTGTETATDAAPAAADTPAETAAVTAADEETLSEETAAASEDGAAVPVGTGPVAGPTPPPAQTAIKPGAARVVVSVASDSWVQVRDSAGAVVFTKLLRPGETYNVPTDKTGYILLTGNAGALRLSVDGQALPPLGEPGQVRRDIPLDADKLLAISSTNN